MAADLETHDRLVAEVVAVAGGRVFKHTGDGMIAVFDDPVAAVGAAAGIQRAVGGTAWQHSDGVQVRAAVHSGVVYERDGDMFGTAVNKLARILGACPPGGVLVSNAIAVLLDERAPEGLGVRAVGEVVLAGFTSPEPVHAVSGAGVAEVNGPVVLGSGQVAGSLPPIDDELIGRADELAEVWDGLSRGRLVTLVGVGGMGKTRLALEVAASGVDVVAGGAWWIDLSNATTPDAVLPVAMAAVGVRETVGRTALESVCDRFAGRSALVVVDNCEHVLAAARRLVTAVRAAAPQVWIVATSREALGVRGEQLVPVGSLPGDDGVALFVERALAWQPTLDIDSDRPMIERICARLDGIPLAIELAAARCRSMSPAEIDGRLDDRFRLLRGGREGAERHRTLRAAVAWSYELLDPDERHVFDTLAVFAGGTLIDGLAAVCGMDELDLLDVVDRLIARSMVVTSRTSLGTRYEQLETLRQFAEDRLVEAGSIDQVRERHLTWVHQLAMWIGSCDATPAAADGFGRFCAEVDNLRVAVAQARSTGHHRLTHEIVAAVANMAYERPVHEVFDWVRPILLEDDWTDAAAICAAWGVSADVVRGAHPGDGPIGGVPERFLAHPVVLSRHASVQINAFGRWKEALALLDGFTSGSGSPGVELERSWVTAQCLRQFGGGPGAEIDDGEWLVIGRRAEAAVATARTTGDDLLLGSQAYRVAMMLTARDPERALQLADEALEIGVRLNARTLIDHARSARLSAVSRIVAAHPNQVRTLAGEMRDSIVAALDGGNRRVLILTIVNAASLLMPADAASVYTYLAVLRTRWNADSIGHLTPPDGWPAWDQRATTVSHDDAVRAIVAALDRLIAAEAEAPAAEGGDT